MPAKTESLADRLAMLIEREFEGSVRRAALQTGVPRPTLARIVSGQTENPRAGVVSQLAAYFDTSVEWLLTGKGEVPRKREPADANPYLAWWHLVARLRLDEDARRALIALPTNAESVATGPLRGLWPTKNRRALWPPLFRAMRQEARFWTTLVEGMIAEVGIERVREQINARWQDLEEYSKRGQRAAEDRARSRRKS